LKRMRPVILAGLILSGSTVCAWSQEPGDPRQGEAFARAACSQCHAVGRNDLRSPNRYVPSFRNVAKSPGMTATALFVWFEIPHPSMPNLILRRADKDNVFAYILSLKDEK
jgi:mono/diheme cytochrome c family protein